MNKWFRKLTIINSKTVIKINCYILKLLKLKTAILNYDISHDFDQKNAVWWASIRNI